MVGCTVLMVLSLRRWWAFLEGEKSAGSPDAKDSEDGRMSDDGSSSSDIMGPLQKKTATMSLAEGPYNRWARLWDPHVKAYYTVHQDTSEWLWEWNKYWSWELDPENPQLKRKRQFNGWDFSDHRDWALELIKCQITHTKFSLLLDTRNMRSGDLGFTLREVIETCLILTRHWETREWGD